MLEFIRKSASSTTFKILAGVLACTFIFCFGMYDVIRRWTGKDYVVKIGNTKITPVMFSMEKAKKLNMLRSHEKNIDEKAEINNILHQIIWENVIDQASADFGFRVSENTIKKYIAGMGIFRDKEGRFNAGMLRHFLQNINVSEPMFIEFSGKDIKNALIKAPFKYVSVYRSLDYHVKSNLEKRALSVVEINPDSIKINEKPTQSELEDFYAENQDLFMVDESRNFSVVILYEDNVVKNISVSEEEKKEFYKTSREREDRTYDEMKDEIAAEITQNKLQNEIDEKTRVIEDALMAGENIDEVIKKFHLDAMRITDATALDKAGKAKSNIKQKYYEDILTVAFSTDEGADSSFAEAIDEKGRRLLWLVHVDSVTPKHVAEFSSVKDKTNKEWIKKQQHDKAIELAQSFCKAVKEGGKLQAIAAKNGRKAFSIKPFDRNGNLIAEKEEKKEEKNNTAKKNQNDEKTASIALAFAENAFSSDQNSAHYKEMNNIIVVAQVEKIIPAGDINNEELTSCHVDLIRRVSDDLYQQLVGYLSREKYAIKINNELLEKEGANTSQENEIF